jgi:isopropylmalate/homocitrate/citramalate synthase
MPTAPPNWRSESWWTSSVNFLPEVRNQFSLPAEVQIHDATLRDGEQTPGVVLRRDDKVRIAELLDEIGVHRIEAGMPAVSSEDAEAIKIISRRARNAKVYAFVRAMEKDIDVAHECGASGVIIEVPVGQPKLELQFKWTMDHVLAQSIRAIKRSKELGLHTVFFPYDTTRVVVAEFQQMLTRLMNQAAPDSVGVIDTTGCAIPAAIKYLVKLVQTATKLPVEIHTHNDIGMAVANEMAAVEAGATVVHTCINGIGERTGNAALEEVAVALKTLYGYEWGFRFDKLAELSALTQCLTAFPMAPNKPIVGSGNFTRESGIGIDMVYKEPLAMFSLHPGFVGQQPKAVLGKKSGYASISTKLQELKLDYPEDKQKFEVVLQKVKQLGTEKKALVSDDEFRAIVKEVLG